MTIEWIGEKPGVLAGPATTGGEVDRLFETLAGLPHGFLGLDVTSPECQNVPGLQACLQDLEANATQRCETAIGPDRPNDAGYNSLQDCIAQETFKDAQEKCMPLCQDWVDAHPPGGGGGGGGGTPPKKPCQNYNPTKGRYENIVCPEGQECNPETNKCEQPSQPTPTSSRRKGNWGLALLGAAALAAAYFLV